MPSGAVAPVLFLSPRARFAAGTGIRGGVPVCFPWFANHATDATKPAHGFARTSVWSLDELAETHDTTRVVLRLGADPATRALWPHEFRATLTLSLGIRLEMRFAVENTSPADCSYEAALHTYLTVGDVGRVAIHGLGHTRYIDKVDRMREKASDVGALTPAAEVDRVFIDTTAACLVSDPGLERTIRVDKTGSRTTVVWNPGPVKGPAISDLGDDAWRRFICVETANTGAHAVRLPPGGRHEMTATISAGALAASARP
jgi:D-hexose-6-phosphate mutarotase